MTFKSRPAKHRFGKTTSPAPLTWPRAPDCDVVSLADLRELVPVPRGGQDVGQEHDVLVVQLAGDLEAVQVGCGKPSQGVDVFVLNSFFVN